MFPYGVNWSLPEIGISARLCRFQENPGYYSGGGIKRYEARGKDEHRYAAQRGRHACAASHQNNNRKGRQRKEHNLKIVNEQPSPEVELEKIVRVRMKYLQHRQRQWRADDNMLLNGLKPCPGLLLWFGMGQLQKTDATISA